MTQASPAPAQIAPPPPPGVPGINQVTPRSLSPREVGAARSRGEELSNQLTSAVGRRNKIQQQLQGATGANKAGLEQRLGVLDARIARLETDIDENGKTLASLPAQFAGSTQPPFQNVNGGAFNNVGRNMVPIVAIFTIFVLSPIALSISRWFWKRGSAPRMSAPQNDHTERLHRMEQAIDSIAIEMERVSEGQRFVTRILAEGKSLGAGAAQPISVPVGEHAGMKR